MNSGMDSEVRGTGCVEKKDTPVEEMQARLDMHVTNARNAFEELQHKLQKVMPNVPSEPIGVVDRTVPGSSTLVEAMAKTDDSLVALIDTILYVVQHIEV